MRSIRIPADRVGTLIGKGGETKKTLQSISGIKLDIDTEEGEVVIHDDVELEDPVMALKIQDVIKAVGRGFNPDKAMRLFDDDEYLEVVDLKEFVGDRSNQITRIRGRLIGKDGKTRRIIEDLTGCDMVIADFYRVVGEMVSQKGDIDADQVIGREAFVGFMMENPADYYYGVLWNKLYRRSLVEAHGIRMDAKLSWCEDFLFNLEYVRYATTFYALRTPVYYYVKTKGSLVNQKISFARTVEMKLAMFECYNDFFKHVLDEDAYERKRLQVYHFLVDAAKDGFVFPATIPGTQKLGEERSQALQEVISEDGIIVEKYRDRKLLERYLESVALKYDMTLAELSLLLYRKDAGKALTRGAEAQMPAREDAVEATDRKDAGKALSRKDLAELMHMSRGDLRAALQKLVSRGMLEVVDVPRKRREAAEIAEATGLFGKRGEAQDADANGMTKKKREPRKIRLELLPASDAVLQDIAAAERDYEQAKFRGFTEDELRQYTALERRVQENEKQILQK